MLFKIASLIIIASLAQAEDFQAEKIIPTNLKCQNQNGLALIEGQKIPYKTYGDKIQKLLECQLVKINNEQFYTLKFESTEEMDNSSDKILIFEIAGADVKNKSLRALRSEIVDRLKSSVDLPANVQFRNSISAQWGKSQKDGQTMLKITIAPKETEPSSTYLIKLNPAKSWFENVF